MSWFRKNEIKKAQYEFLPAAEELIESPPSPLGRIVLWIIIGLLAVTLAWLYLGKIDVIAVAASKVVPDGSAKVVQSATGGVVTEINVTEGQKVNKGQVLIRLDASLEQSAVDTLQQQLVVAKLEREILRAIANGQDASAFIDGSDIPQNVRDDLVDFMRVQNQSTADHTGLLNNSVSQAQNNVLAAQQAQSGVELEIRKNEVNKAVLEQLLAATTDATQKSQIQVQIYTLTTKLSDLNSSLAQQRQQTVQAQLGVTEASLTMQNFISEAKATNFSKVIEQDKAIATLQDNLVKARKALGQQTLIAPVDGIVLMVSVKTLGAVATSAQPLVTIIPDNADLYLEATVSPSDIGYVHAGQKVAVKLDTYSFQRYGLLDAKVVSISPDVVPSDDGKSFGYKAKVVLNDTKTSKGVELQLIPGMTATSEVITGKRRIVEFFLDPLMTHIDDSLKAR